MTRTIRGVALGTYYAARADAARRTANSREMRGLVYAVKDNRPSPNPPQPIAHPRHPLGPVMVDRRNAIEYVTSIVARYTSQLARFFGGTPEETTLVPVPSSEVTAATIETARFPTHRLCRALAGAGLGTVRVLAVQRHPVAARAAGHRRTAQEVFDGLVRTTVAAPRTGLIVLVDDNVNHGASLAALDALLGASLDVAAFAVALTDSQPRPDAYDRRRFDVKYDPEERPLAVEIVKR